MRAHLLPLAVALASAALAAGPSARAEEAAAPGDAPNSAAVDALEQDAPANEEDAEGRLRLRARRAEHDDHGAALMLRFAAFRLQQGNLFFQRDAIYGELRPSCALTSCDTETRSYFPTWDGLMHASTTLAFAAVGVGATWLVATPSERIGVSSIEIKLTTGGTTGLTLVGRF